MTALKAKALQQLCFPGNNSYMYFHAYIQNAAKHASYPKIP